MPGLPAYGLLASVPPCGSFCPPVLTEGCRSARFSMKRALDFTYFHLLRLTVMSPQLFVLRRKMFLPTLFVVALFPRYSWG